MQYNDSYHTLLLMSGIVIETSVKKVAYLQLQITICDIQMASNNPEKPSGKLQSSGNPEEATSQLLSTQCMYLVIKSPTTLSIIICHHLLQSVNE